MDVSLALLDVVFVHSLQDILVQLATINIF
jgi:hypothetical protein